MPDNKPNTIYFKEDLINRYGDSRKALSRADTEDLLKCVIEFLQKDKEENQSTYAYNLPFLGTIYRDYEEELKLLTGNHLEDRTRFVAVATEEFFGKKFKTKIKKKLKTINIESTENSSE